METVSVIIPIYNVEDYMERCLESVCSQSYQKLEIILVDDGSSDRCPQLCDAWAKKDLRIQVIHQKNRGLSAARNAGLKLSHGNYVLYIDSDDSIQQDMIETLVYLIKYHEADIAISTYYQSMGENKQCFRLSGEIIAGKTEDMLRVIYTNHLWHSWAKLIKWELAMQCPFAEQFIYEDYENTPRLLMRTHKIVISMDGRYCYTIRDNSIMGEHRQTSSPDLAKITEINLKRFEMSNYSEKTKKYLYSIMFKQLAYNYHKALKFKTKKKDLFLIYTSYVFKSYRNKWIRNKEICIQRKCAYFLIACFPGIYRWIYLFIHGDKKYE